MPLALELAAARAGEYLRTDSASQSFYRPQT